MKCEICQTDSDEYFAEHCDREHSFYRTITRSKEWKEWEKVAEGVDVAESRETGWMSPDHWEKFVRFIRKQA